MDDTVLKGKLLQVLMHHVGLEHSIDMGALYEKVFDQEWHNKINDTGALRSKIRALRESGAPIGSCTKGYFLIRSDSELADYCHRQERRALGTLTRLSRIKQISLPKYLGQLQLDLNKE